MRFFVPPVRPYALILHRMFTGTSGRRTFAPMSEGLQKRLAASPAERYVIDRESGRGGMATVYLARDVRHDRNVALKLLEPELGAVRFLSEIRVTATPQHPNLLPLFGSGASDGLLWYVMPCVGYPPFDAMTKPVP